ncbi:MAG: methyl-accepting chemotaxis protein [Nitrospiria bacterium]
MTLNINQLRIRTKLLLGFLFVAALTGLVGAISFYFSTQIGKQGELVAEDIAPRANAVMRVQLDVTRAHLLFEEIMAGDTTENIQDVRDLLDEALWYSTAILEGGKNEETTIRPAAHPDVRKMITAVRTHLRKFKELGESRYQLHQTPAGQKDALDAQGAGSGADEAFDLEYEALVDNANKASLLLHDAIKSTTEHFENVRTQNAIWTLVVSLVSILTALGIAHYLSRDIANPILKSVAFADALADGDMSQDFSIQRKDEFGQLGQAFQRIASNLSDIIHHIRDNSATLATASDKLFEVSTDLSRGTGQINQKSKNVAGACEDILSRVHTVSSSAEQISANTSSISSDTTQVSDSMNSVAAAIEETSVSIKDISKNAEEGAEMTRSAMEMAALASQTINTMEEAALDIGKVTDVIQNIAQQTNLLALNATIEAATAGEAGKGFNVVSNEIKILADRCAASATEIAEKIAEMQTTAQKAVSVVANVSKAIGGVSQTAENIAAAVEQQSHTSNEVSESLSVTTRNTNSTSSSIQELAVGASAMSKSTTEMVGKIGEVVAHINEIDTSIQKTNQGVQQINGSAGDLSSLSRDLQTLIGQFKVNEGSFCALPQDK